MGVDSAAGATATVGQQQYVENIHKVLQEVWGGAGNRGFFVPPPQIQVFKDKKSVPTSTTPGIAADPLKHTHTLWPYEDCLDFLTSMLEVCLCYIHTTSVVIGCLYYIYTKSTAVLHPYYIYGDGV